MVSVGGWLWEVMLFLVKDRQFVNRGFFYGPYLPVYGTGAVVLSILFYDKNTAVVMRQHLSVPKESKSFCLKNCRSRLSEHIRIFLICMFGGSLVEWLIGWFLWNVFHQKYWDYTGYPLNVAGHICLYSALGFGCFGLLWLRGVAPHLIRIWERISFPIQILIVGWADLLFVTDAVFSLMRPNEGKNITFSCLNLLWMEHDKNL